MTTDDRDAALDAKLQQAFATLRNGSGPGPHPSDDDWTRFAANEMSADERTKIADHIVSCAECAAIFRVVSHVGQDATGIETAVQPRAGFDWRMLAAAAAIVLTIGLGAWFALRARGENGGELAGGAAAPASPTPLDVVATPSWASLSSPAPEVRLPPDLVLTMRGAEGDQDGFLKAFGAAIAPYRARQYAESARALEPVAEKYSTVSEVWFYLGAARLYAGRVAGAIEPLQRGQASSVVADDARWLHAVALYRAGRDSEARASLQALCSAPGAYQDRACAAVKP